ncbi:MAG: hypothetical protein ACFNVK_11770 [Prevotella sp.]
MDINIKSQDDFILWVVCDTAKVRFFKQITTRRMQGQGAGALFAILQKYDFSSKSQPISFESIIFLLKRFGGWK